METRDTMKYEKCWNDNCTETYMQKQNTLTDIANELAEANRLKRLELSQIYQEGRDVRYDMPKEELEDKA